MQLRACTLLRSIFRRSISSIFPLTLPLLHPFSLFLFLFRARALFLVLHFETRSGRRSFSVNRGLYSQIGGCLIGVQLTLLMRLVYRGL